MKVDAAPARPNAGFLARATASYEKLTGQPVVAWLLVALANFALQAFFFHAMALNPPSAGEFGILNAALGIIGLLTVPLIAVHEAFRLYPVRPEVTGDLARLDSLRAAMVTVVETAAWILAVICGLLVLLPLPVAGLPRFSLQLLALLNVLLALGYVVSQAVSEGENRLRSWALLVVAAAVARVIIGAGLTSFQPWTDSGLATFLIVGFLTLTPALRPREVDWSARFAACRVVLDRDFLLFAGATFSVLTGLYLFTNADRVIAVTWQGIASDPGLVMGVNIKKVDFDQYQAAGLLGRALLWGTQPLLWILFAQRARLIKTNPASLTFFWIYLGALMGGVIALGLFTQPKNLAAMGAPFSSLGPDGPTFAALMIPLGLLQGVGIFSLASRRYPECFTLGGCSVAYALVLFLFGRRPELMLPYMLGASIVSLMVVLFVGVVRWGRKQP